MLALTAASARAETPEERRAREEVDRELAAMVKIPAPRLCVWLHPVDDPNLRLSELGVKLDGRPLPVKPPEGDLWDPVRIWQGEITPGPHQVSLRIGYRGLETYGRTYHFVLAGGARIVAERGLAIDVHPRVRIDEKAKRFKDRFHLEIGAKPTMLAEVDTSIPEPPPPFVPPKASADAGTAEAQAAPDAGTGEEATATTERARPGRPEHARAMRPRRRARHLGGQREDARAAGLPAGDAPPLEPLVHADRRATSLAPVSATAGAAPAPATPQAAADSPADGRTAPGQTWALLLAVLGGLAVVVALWLLLRPR